MSSSTSTSAGYVISEEADGPVRFDALSGTFLADGVPVGIATSPEAANYAHRVRLAGGLVGASVIAAIDQWVTTGKADGWWDKLIEVWPFCGSNLASALVKLKHAPGAPLLTNANFVAADYSQEEGFGKMSGNTNAILNTGFTPSASGVVYNDVCFGVEFLDFPKTNQIDQTFGALAWPVGSTGQIGINGQLTVGDEVTGFGSQANMSSFCPDGFNLYNANSTVVQSFKAGARTRYGGAPTSAVFAFPITLWGAKLNNNVTYYSNGKMGMVFIGNALTDAQCISINRATINLRKAIRKPRDGLLIAVGDSQTRGSNATSYKASYIFQLAAKIGAAVVNQAQAGGLLSTINTSSIPNYPTAYSFRADATYEKARAIVVCIGTNDIATDAAVDGTAGTISTYQSNLTTMLTDYKATGARVICGGPAYRSDTAQSSLTKQAAYQAAAAAAAKSAGVPFADLYRKIGDQTTPGNFLSQPNHPNDAGHALMAQAMADAWGGLLTRTLSVAPGAIGAGAVVDVAVTILNAVAGMPVRCIPVTKPEAGVTYTAAVTANDTVTVSVYSATALTPAALFVRLEVVCGY